MTQQSATTADWSRQDNAGGRAGLLPRWFKPLLIFTAVVLAFTGFGQMPIYSRYYVSSIPGMAWTADFYLTHVLHYLFGTLFLALLGYVAAGFFMRWRRRYRISVAGWVRIALYAGIAFTGIGRVLKNDPNFFFGPGTVMFLDIGHLAFVMLLGAAALFIRLRGRTPYLQRR